MDTDSTLHNNPTKTRPNLEMKFVGIEKTITGFQKSDQNPTKIENEKTWYRRFDMAN